MNLDLDVLTGAIKRRLGQVTSSATDYLKKIVDISPLGLAKKAYQQGPQIQKAVEPFVSPIVEQAKQLYGGATTVPLSPEDIPLEKQTPAFKLGSALSFGSPFGVPLRIPQLVGKIPSTLRTGAEILQSLPAWRARADIVRSEVSKIPGLENTPIPSAVAFIEPFISKSPTGIVKSFKSAGGMVSRLLKPEPLYKSDLGYVENALKDLSGKLSPERFHELRKTAEAYNEGYKLAGIKEWKKIDLLNKYKLISKKLTDVYGEYYQGQRPILTGFVSTKKPPIQAVGEVKPAITQPTPEEIANIESQILEQARAELRQTKPLGVYQKDFDRHVSLVRLLGGKKTKVGSFFTEHIPRYGYSSSSDEVASNLNMTENDYMQKVQEAAGIVGGQRPVMPKLAKPIKITEAIPKVPEAEAIAPPKIQKPIKVPYAYGQKQMMIEGKPVNIHPTIMKKIVDRQLNKINVLRKKAKLPLRTFKQFMQDLTGKTSPKKLTYEEAKNIKGMLTPPKTEEFKANIEKVRAQSLASKVESFKGVGETPQIAIDKFGIKDFFDKTKGDISTFVENVKDLGKPSKTRGSPAQLLLAESTAASLGGVKPFQVKIKNIVDLANNYRRNFNSLLGTVFQDLSKAEKQAVLKLTSGVQEKNISPLIKERAQLLKNIFSENLKITNKLRELRGLKPIPERKNYIPFYLQPELREVFGLGDTYRFDIERTKTNQELLAGLFSLDPEVLIEKYVNASAKFLKRNLYSAFLSDKAKDWSGKSSYAQMLIDKNIMDIPDSLQKLSKEQAEGLNGLLGKIFPKKLQLAPDLQKALKETSFYEDAMFKKQIDTGTLSLPRFSTPDLTNIARDTFILSKLAFNTRFFVTNLTQTILGIPFTGVGNFAKGELKILSAWMPKNTTELKNLNSMLTELGSMSDRMITGEELALHNYLVNTSMKFLGSFARLSELHNRLSSGEAASSFLRGIETKTGMKFAPRDFDKIVNEYVKFIHFTGGKGYSAMASRGSIGKLAYIFQQYGLYVLRVYGQQLKVGFKDKGLQDFWKIMAEEGGASNASKAIFDKMPIESKARILRTAIGMLGGASTIYALTGSWGAFQRLLPLQGITPDTSPAFLQIANAMNDFLQTPDEEKFKKLEDTWKKTFSITQIGRLEDAFKLWKEGKIVDEKGHVLYEGAPEDVFKLAFWGRGITFEKTITERQDIYKLRQEGIARGEDEAIKAAKIYEQIKDLSKEERHAKLKELKQQKILTKETYDKLDALWKERQLELTKTETAYSTLPVLERASRIYKDIEKIPVSEQRKYLSDLKKKKILTEQVFIRMQKLGYILPSK